jgi:hypothetical protein
MTDQMLTADGTEKIGETPVTSAPSKRARRRSSAATLLQVAALAAALVPLGSVAAEASTCHFDGSGSPNCGISGIGADGFAFFGFDDPTYKVALAFDKVIGEFDVTITATEMDETTALAKMAAFPGFHPVPIGSNSSTPFIDFNVSAPPPCTTDAECAPGANTWRSDSDPDTRGPGVPSGYELRIYWTKDTDAMGFTDPHVLHATGGSDVYDHDITDPDFPYTTEIPKCSIFDCEVTDPAVGGRDDMFTTFGAGDPTNPVPEPASLVLLGGGVSAWLYRRRRK